jgi:hypothetical protein
LKGNCDSDCADYQNQAENPPCVHAEPPFECTAELPLLRYENHLPELI